jgi:hypothetical protein
MHPLAGPPLSVLIKSISTSTVRAGWQNWHSSTQQALSYGDLSGDNVSSALREHNNMS